MAKKRETPGWVSWSNDEVKLLKRLFPRGKAKQVAAITGRQLTAVRQKAYSMGMRTRSPHVWTRDEIEYLKKVYFTEDIQVLADKFNMKPHSVKHKARYVDQ